MHVTWVGVVSLLLFGWSLAQEIRVNFDNAPIVNNKLTLTVPRVSKVVLESMDTIQYVANTDGCEERPPSHTCTLILSRGRNTFNLLILVNSTNNIQVNVMVKVRDDYEVGCLWYQFPVKLDLTERTGALACEPVFVNSSRNASAVTWYTSLYSNGENATELNQSRVMFQESQAENASIIFNDAREEDAAYYFPVTNEVSNLSRIAPILVTYEPRILTKIEEFSVDFYLNPNIPSNHTFHCEVLSFPTARVIWRYNNTQPGTPNTTLMISNSRLLFTINPGQQNEKAKNFNLTIKDVDYQDSGIYSCFPENDAFLVEMTPPVGTPLNAHSFRLRVKDHLRPLWPAIGIIGVATFVMLFILFGALYDRFRPKKHGAESSPRGERPFSVTSTSSGSPETGPFHHRADGHLHIRRISSARVQLLEETGNNN